MKRDSVQLDFVRRILSCSEVRSRKIIDTLISAGDKFQKLVDYSCCGCIYMVIKDRETNKYIISIFLLYKLH
ncbi:hypothetical protein AU467_31240 [Mesorhizobium loti]|uniref:Uncharacterized protein n=1 Tax=Rhizobium loti TaxID=381 RepID=A0A117N273_RHILI|nr:hypothetical protein AU467_31240 [Mesorhizobium loti]